MAYINSTRVMHVTVTGPQVEGLKQTATGNPAVPDYVHPTEHVMDVRLENRNLFDIDTMLTTHATKIGDSEFTAAELETAINFPTVAGETYTVSFIGIATVLAGGGLVLSAYSVKDKVYEGISEDCLFVHTNIDELERRYTHTFTATSDWVSFQTIIPTIRELQIELGTEATPYTPHIADFSAVTLTRYGENLIDGDAAVVGGINYLTGEDEANTTTLRISDYIPVTGTDMHFKYDTFPDTQFIMYAYDEKKNYISDGYLYFKSTNKPLAITLVNGSIAGEVAKYIRFVCNSTTMPTGLFFGTCEAEYTPYIEPTKHTANTDGTVPGVCSVSPVTTLLADTDGVIITAGYYLDAKSKIADLEETILTLGGDV